MFKNFFKNKQALILIAVIIIIGLIIWLTLPKDDQSSEQLIQTEDSTQSQDQPSKTQTATKQISLVMERVNSYQYYTAGLYFFRSQDSSFYYLANNTSEPEKVYQITGLANDQEVYQVIFAPEQAQAIVRTSTASGLENQIVNLETGASKELSNKISSPQWLNKNTLIYIYSENESKGSISKLNTIDGQYTNVKNLTFNQERPIEELKATANYLFISYLTGFHSDFASLHKMDKQGQAVVQISDKIYGFLPSLDGKKVALINPNENGALLTIKDWAKDQVITTEYNIESIYKISWQNENTLLVSVGSEQENNENLIAINTLDNSKSIFWPANTNNPHSFNNMKVFQNKIYFLDNAKLYQIGLNE